MTIQREGLNLARPEPAFAELDVSHILGDSPQTYDFRNDSYFSSDKGEGTSRQQFPVLTSALTLALGIYAWACMLAALTVLGFINISSFVLIPTIVLSMIAMVTLIDRLSECKRGTPLFWLAITTLTIPLGFFVIVPILLAGKYQLVAK